MNEVEFPELSEGQRWRFTRYADSKELRLEEKGWFLWHPIARVLLSEYGTPEDAVKKAIEQCLDGRNWLAEIDVYSKRRQAIAKRRRAKFPDGVVK